MVLDKSFRPLRLEIEITDTMDSEKVLINAGQKNKNTLILNMKMNSLK
jgi:hypothetical protein